MDHRMPRRHSHAGLSLMDMQDNWYLLLRFASHGLYLRKRIIAMLAGQPQEHLTHSLGSLRGVHLCECIQHCGGMAMVQQQCHDVGTGISSPNAAVQKVMETSACMVRYDMVKGGYQGSYLLYGSLDAKTLVPSAPYRGPYQGAEVQHQGTLLCWQAFEKVASLCLADSPLGCYCPAMHSTRT